MDNDTTIRVAVVTGANRGIGFATVKQLCKVFVGKVFLTTRSPIKGQRAVIRLNRMGLFPSYYQLDIAVPQQRVLFAKYLNATYGGLDVLVNSAAFRSPVSDKPPITSQASATLHVNFYSLFFMCLFMFPLLRPHARVVNVGSPCGHLSTIPTGEVRSLFGGSNLTVAMVLKVADAYKIAVEFSDARSWGNDSYCISKVCVTALTLAQQNQFREKRPADDIIVNCYSPGDVRSPVTGYTGNRSATSVAQHILQLVTLPDNTTSPVGEYLWHDLSVVDFFGEKPST